MRKQLNVKLLAWTMALGAFAAVGIFLLHAYQVRRNARVLLGRAEEVRAQGQRDKALTYLNDYLALAPEDTDALATLTVMIDEAAKTPRGRMRSFMLGEQVLRRDPSRSDLRRRMVDIAMNLRRFTDAVAHLQVLRAGAPADADLAHLLGVCLEAGNQFAEANEAFQDAVRLAPARVDSATQLATLQRRKLNQASDADRVMDQLVANSPKDSKAWIARGYYRREFGGHGEAATDIQRALELAPDDADVLYAAADFANRQGNHDQARDFLRKAIGRYPQDSRMYQMLASLELALGKRPEAIAQLRKGLEAIPRHTELLFSLGQVLIDTGENAEARGVLQRLREAGCPATFLDFLEAHLLIGENQWDKATGLLEAVVPHLAEVPRLATKADFLLGRCYKHQGDGERRLGAFRRVIAADPFWIDARLELAATLADLRKGEEATEEYRQLLTLILNAQDRDGLSPELKRLAAEVALRAKDVARAVEWARAAVDATSSNYRDHLWLGQLLASADQPQDAERALRRAVALGSDKSEPYGALIQVLARAKRPAEAEQLLGQARAKLSGRGADRFLAQAYETLGQEKKAVYHYQTALAAQPDDFGIVRSLARLLLSAKQYDEAEVHLRRLLDDKARSSPQDRAWAAQALAKALAARGDYRRYQEALALLDRHAQSTPATAEEQRTRALVLATQPFAAARREAVQLLETLVQSPNVLPEDRLLLAQLYENGQEWPKARTQLNRYLATGNAPPQFLASHARRLLRHGDMEEARLWQRKLAALDPTGFAALETEARLLTAEGQAKDAATLLARFVDEGKQASPEVRAGLAASLLEELGQAEPAEKLYRLHAQKVPEHFLLLAEFLARQKRLREALDVCERSAPKPGAEALASVGMPLLRLAPFDAAQGQRVDSWLAESLQLKPDSMPFVNQLAELREMQGRFDDAERLYRQVLARQNGNIVALNNLAWILALKDQRAQANEALELINRAIEAVGPRPELVDTRAVVHLALNRSDLAIQDLDELVRQTPSQSALFHLARAHHQARDLDTAADAFLKAKKSGLASAQLHALERKTFADLEKALEPQ